MISNVSETSGSYQQNFLEPYRNRLLNMSIQSAESKDFITVERTSSDDILNLRPTIHITQITPYGLLKTTLANRIRNYCETKKHPFLKVSSVTAPSIAGSIDERYKVIPPLSADYLNGTIVVDEFKTNPMEKSEAIGCALDVLESEESSRTMARCPRNNKVKVKNPGVNYEVANGRIRFWNLRSNWIFLSAKYLQMNRSLPMAMLISRTIPVWFAPNYDELDKIDDDPSLCFHPMNLEMPEWKTVDNENYLTIRTYVRKSLQSLNIPPNYYLRTVDDCVRAYVFNHYKHDFGLYDYILKSKIMFVSDQERIGRSLAELEMSAENLLFAGKKDS